MVPFFAKPPFQDLLHQLQCLQWLHIPENAQQLYTMNITLGFPIVAFAFFHPGHHGGFCLRGSPVNGR